MTEDSALVNWLDQFVQTSLNEDAVARFVEVVDHEILRTLPELAVDAVLVEDLHRSTRHQWLAFLTALRRPTHELVLPSQAFDLARSLARRGMEVRVLLRVYLNAHHGVFTYLGEEIDRMSAERPAPEGVLRTVWRRADLWMDESVETLIESFYEERQREVAGSAARKSELVDTILANGSVDVEAASRSLGHPLQLHHTAFLLWAQDVDDHTPSTLQTAAEKLTRRFPGGSLLTQLTGSRDLRCWVATPKAPSADMLDALPGLPCDNISVAIGRPALGIEGFRISHLDARAAQRLGLAATTPTHHVDYRKVELLCLAIADGPALERMVRREIGPLCRADKNLAPIRDTVLLYVQNRLNVEATAELLHVHSNTVRYRLAKAEELLGHQLADRSPFIELALQHVVYFGLPSE